MPIRPIEDHLSLESCVDEAFDSPVILTRAGRAVAAVVSVENEDLDDLMIRYSRRLRRFRRGESDNESDDHRPQAKGVKTNKVNVHRDERRSISDPELRDLYLDLRPHLLTDGCQVYPTNTPDIRARIPQRKKANVFALVKVRRDHLLLYLCVGKSNVKTPLEHDQPFNLGKAEDIWFGTYRLVPTVGITKELLQLIDAARKNLMNR